MKKLRVGVWMGGVSEEREVSFNSGRTVCEHLDTRWYEVIPLFQSRHGMLYILPWRFINRGKISDFEQRLDQEAQRISWSEIKNNVDFMYIAMHGRCAEDGTLQGMLELLEIPYLGTKIFGSAVCMDKIFVHTLLRSHGVKVPASIVVMPAEIGAYATHQELIMQRLVAAHISFPVIVKPHNEGSSLGVTAVGSEEGLLPALTAAMNVYPRVKQAVLIEEKIEGMEFSCIILTDYVTGNPLFLPPTEIVPESDVYDYEQKYMPGRALEFTPARCSEENREKIQHTCLRVKEVLHMSNFVRIDGFLTKQNEVVIIDPNTITGMAPASFLFREAAEIGMNHVRLINHLIETELRQDERFNAFITARDKKNLREAAEKKMKIAVLFGGQSNEKEISFESGRNVIYKLSGKYTVIPVFLDKHMEPYIIDERILLRHATQEVEFELKPEMKIAWDEVATIADFVFIALHGGKGENGTVQGALETLGIPYNGSGVLTSSLCMNKYETNRYLAACGFDVPSNLLLEKTVWEKDKKELLATLKETFGFPLIIKPHDDGCSVMVHKMSSESEAQRCIEQIFTSGKTAAMIEECIEGMELTVGVIGNHEPQALPASQAISRAGILSIQEKFLPGAGENQTPALLTKTATARVQKTMQDVYRAVGCKGYARIDCFYQNQQQSSTGSERVVILEINTLPALTPATCLFHQAAEVGIKPTDFIDMIVNFGLELHGKKTESLPAVVEQIPGQQTIFDLSNDQLPR